MVRLRGSLWLLALALPIAVGGVACDKRKREINGIGSWVLGKTLLPDAPGICSPEGDVTWCHSNPTIMLGDQEAQVDLYFRGPGDKAALVEILLNVRACKPAGVESALVGALGEPSARRAKRLIWRGSAAVIVAQLPADAMRCEVNFVAAGDAERIAELEAGAPAPAETP